MSDFRKRLIHLHSCRGVSWKLLYKILTNDPPLKNIFKYSLSDLQRHYFLSPNTARNLFHDLHTFTSEQILSYYRRKKIVPITIIDSTYPTMLRQIADPPFVLYAKGVIKHLHSLNQLAVIGSRKPSEIGIKTVAYLLPILVKNGWTIVSGFARGIDTVAHKQSMRANGKTIAVLGSGFDYVYPKENKKIFTYMSKKQLILSEYPPYTPPRRWHFPERNRIISGLSKAVLVIEATERSGTLITVDQALEQGRDVFAVPGTIFQKQSAGTNKLIQQGAKLVLTAEDILCEL